MTKQDQSQLVSRGLCQVLGLIQQVHEGMKPVVHYARHQYCALREEKVKEPKEIKMTLDRKKIKEKDYYDTKVLSHHDTTRSYVVTGRKKVLQKSQRSMPVDTQG